MDQSEALPPGSCVQNRNRSAVVPHSEGQGVGAEFTRPYSRFEFCILIARIMRLSKRAYQLAVRGVEEKVPTMRRRFPEQKPLAVGGPGQSLRIDSIWRPGSLKLPSARRVDAYDVSPTNTGQQ